MVRYIEVENRKGKILRGFLNLPDGVAHPPVVLNLHGFGGSLSGYKYAHTHLARTLEAEGIACMRLDRKSTRLNSSHITRSRMPSSA